MTNKRLVEEEQKTCDANCANLRKLPTKGAAFPRLAAGATIRVNSRQRHGRRRKLRKQDPRRRSTFIPAACGRGRHGADVFDRELAPARLGDLHLDLDQITRRLVDH